MPASSPLDRLIARWAPVHALRRERARLQLQAVDALHQHLGTGGGGATVPDTGAHTSGGGSGAGGYESTNGSHAAMRRWGVLPRDASADTLPHLKLLRAQSRDLVRNNGLAGSAIETNTTRVVGTGLAYSAQPHLPTLGWSPAQAEAWRVEVQAEFSLWADSTACDIANRLTFYDLQDLALRTMLESGDGFTLLPDADASTTWQPYRLRVQLLEADRIGNPANAADRAGPDGHLGGLRFSAAGLLQSAYVYGQHPGMSSGSGDRFAGQWVDFVGPSGRRRLLQLVRLRRPEQPRGVPYLAPVMSLFKQLGSYTDAEVQAAVVSAFLTLIIEAPAPSGVAPVFGLGANGTPGAGPAGDEIALGPAAVLGLSPGEKANIVNPGRPNPAFGPFVETVLNQLGAGLFIGSEMLLKRYSTSYTAARAAFLDAWKHLAGLRVLLARQWCQPILETWMAEAVATGRLRAPGFFTDARLRWAYTRAAWRGDSQGSINPKDEVAAMLSARDGRLITSERATWELFGSDWNDDFSTMVAEHRRMTEDDMLPTPKAGAPAPAPSAAPGPASSGAPTPAPAPNATATPPATATAAPDTSPTTAGA
jgi:lambda family phage portal protein